MPWTQHPMSGIGKPARDDVPPAHETGRLSPQAFLFPAILMGACFIDGVFSLDYVMTLGIAWFLGTAFGLVWTLLALNRSGERRARSVACWMFATGLSPFVGGLIAQPVHDAMLALSTFRYDAAVQAAVKANGSQATQLVLSDQTLHHEVKLGGTSEAIIYDSTDSIRKGSNGETAGFNPPAGSYSVKAKVHRIKWLRSHYYSVIRDSFVLISRADLGMNR